MKTLIRALMISLLATLLISAGALAAYSAAITVIESSSNSYDMLSIGVAMDNSALADSYYITSTGLDTKVLQAGTPLPHMLASDRTLFALPISADTQYQLDYTTGNAALGSFYTIVGYNGCITVADNNTDLEFGNNFTVEIKGYVDTDAGSDKNLVYKASAFRLYISAAGTITATINPGGTETTVSAAGVSSGIHIIKVDADGTDLKIYIDGAVKDTETIVVGVTNNDSEWKMLQNNVMPYMEYMKWWIG